MTSKHDMRHSGAGGLAGLPRDLDPPPDAWNRIAARLGSTDSGALRAGPLPADIDPPADLWPKIALRLDAGVRRRRTVAALSAAAALGAIALVAFIAVREVQPPPAELARAPLPAAASLGAAWMLSTPEISSEVAATLRRELELVRDERLRIEQALESEPGNATLHELWAHAYEVELELADVCGRTVMAYQRG